MNHRIGDKVRIRSLEWYEANKDEDGKILCLAPSGRKFYFTPELTSLCGKEAFIKAVFKQLDAGFYFLQGWEGYAFTDDMFEGNESEKCIIEAEQDMRWARLSYSEQIGWLENYKFNKEEGHKESMKIIEELFGFHNLNPNFIS